VPELGMLGIIVLFAVGYALLIIEMFVPGGVIGLIGFGCVAAAIVLAMALSVTFGVTLAVITVLSIPILILLWAKVISRVLAIKNTEAGYTSAQVHLKDIVGQEGVAITQLRPAGTARIAGAKIDVVSQGPVIEKDTRVKIIKVKANRVVVRAVKG
jgi:membrane-bound serine protease (ClpP class)